MLERSAAYDAAITGDTRRILLRAVVHVIDPDIRYEAVTSSGEAAWSRSAQLHDREFSPDRPYVTLEPGRWPLDGTAELMPADILDRERQEGFVGDTLCDGEGVFQVPPTVQVNFSGVEILQACSIWFSDRERDGIGEDFTVDILQGGEIRHSVTVTGNTALRVRIEGFTVYGAEAVRVTVRRWSIPYRRVRIAEILPGYYEEWDNDMIAAFSLKQQGNFACLALPYGTCALTIDNTDRRFEPRNKSGMFRSLTARQGIELSIGVILPDGSAEYKSAGIMYQHNGGWRTSNNGMTLTWNLVDILGLLAQRAFIPPATLPETLSGWIGAITAQLGENFAEHFTVDATYGDLPVTTEDVATLRGTTCGSVLRWVCMATGTWPRADARTGALAVEPLWSQGNLLTLDNVESYPTMKANDDLAALLFTLSDGTQAVFAGNTTAAGDTVSIRNPFIHGEREALAAARMILSCYGGNLLEVTGRGDPSSEIGDVATVELDESTATTARVQQQTFSIRDGVLQGCRTVMLQADGAFLFEGRALLTESGTWTAPAGVRQLRVIIGNGGAGGTAGSDGSFDAAGENGTDGAGGLVLVISIGIEEQQSFDVVIGAGGAPGEEGGVTTFGAYSGADGQLYAPSFTDITAGDAFCRTGVAVPESGTGDGGAGGRGGAKGTKHRGYLEEIDPDGRPVRIPCEVIDTAPGKGEAGRAGASGFVAIYWDKEDET